jgi:RNA polymerase sigma-70 factor, ECF subfamily
MQSRKDAELVALTLGGDTRAFGELVRRYQGSLHGLAYGIVGDRSEAEDLTQAAFLRAYLGLAALRDPSRFAPWLRRVATTTCLNWLDARRPERRAAVADLDEIDLDAPEPAPDEQVAREQIAHRVQAALQELPSRYRVPLVMFYLDGESYDAMAALLGKSVGTVKSLVHRAREKLRGPLSTLAPDRLPKEFAMRIADILDAAKRGDAPAVARLLARDASLANGQGEYAKTPLHLAAEKDHRAIAELLLDAGADVERQTSWGATALRWAATLGSKEVGRLLLERGARGLDLYGAAGLGMIDVVASSLASGAVVGRALPTGEELENVPADAAVMRGDAVSDAFYLACRNGELDVAKLLLEHGADVDAKGYFGGTGLHWAAHNGHTEVVEWLLERGANPNLHDAKFGARPPGWATQNGHREIARRIVAGGGEVDACEAANYGLLEPLRALLDADPSRVGMHNGWGTPLHEAVFFGHEDIVALLLARGADPQATTCRGETAHDLATSRKHEAIAAMLAAHEGRGAG